MVGWTCIWRLNPTLLHPHKTRKHPRNRTIRRLPGRYRLDIPAKIPHLPFIGEPVPREHVKGPDIGSHRTQGFRAPDGIWQKPGYEEAALPTAGPRNSGPGQAASGRRKDYDDDFRRPWPVAQDIGNIG